MPDLTTKPMTYDQAMTILQDLVAEYELNVQPYEETQKEYDDELAVDVIKSTTPAANEELHKGDTITFVLSRGPQTVPLIDFTNRERAWAEDQLKNVLGLEVEVHEEANDTVEAGLVIRQNPTATTRCLPRTVELWVSTARRAAAMKTANGTADYRPAHRPGDSRSSDRGGRSDQGQRVGPLPRWQLCL